MRYFEARRYVHASEGDMKTLCGQFANLVGGAWCVEWTEVRESDFKLKPCPVCKKRIQNLVPKTTAGKQTTLETTA